MELVHYAIRVSDLEVSKRFYEDAIGLDYKWDYTHDETGTRHYYVSGEGDSELQLMYNPDEEVERKNVGTIETDAGEYRLTVPKVHVSVVVDDDVHDVFERAVELPGSETIQEPITEVFEDGKSQLAFLTDPDGHAVELNFRSGEDHPLITY